MNNFSHIMHRFPFHPIAHLAAVGDGVVQSLPLDVIETSDGFEIYVDVPGSKVEDIDLKYENSALTIVVRGEVRSVGEGDKMLLNERSFSRKARSVSIATPINKDGIDASLSNGVLMVTLPKERNTTSAIRINNKV